MGNNNSWYANVQIFEQDLLVKNGVVIAKLAILRGGLYSDNPTEIMNNVVKKYVGNTPICQFVNIKLNDPWTRVIIYGINELKYYDFDNYKLLMTRIAKLDKINKSSR